MVAFCRMTSDVRKSMAQRSGMPDSTRDFLDFRVLEWRRNLPARLQFRGLDDKFNPRQEWRGHYRIRLMLYLRANQMRTIVHRVSAMGPAPGFDVSNANVMAEIAQDTIRVLLGLARDTDIYRAQHHTFNHFLQTALSSLLLAMCCTGDVDMTGCLGDAHAAMDLVQRLSTESPITRRLLDKLQHVQDTLDSLKPRAAEVCAEPSRRALPAADAEPSRRALATGDAEADAAQPHAMSIAAISSPTSRTLSESFASPYLPTDSFASAPFPIEADAAPCASGYLMLMRFPELGEILNDYENNFAF